MKKLVFVALALLLLGSAEARKKKPKKPKEKEPATETTSATGEKVAIQKGGSREYVIGSSGDSVTVPVSSAFVTVLYFPDAVDTALASDQKNYSISTRRNLVIINPMDDDAPVANLNVITESGVKVAIVLETTTEDQALSLVTFVRADEKQGAEARIEEEVAKRLAPLQAALEAQSADVETKVQERADREISRRLLRRMSAQGLKAIERNDRGVVIRVHRALVLGDDVYLAFELQNRGDGSYKLVSVEASQGDEKVATQAILQDDVRATDALASVKTGDTAYGLVVTKVSALTAKQDVTLRFADDQGDVIEVGRIKLAW